MKLSWVLFAPLLLVGCLGPVPEPGRSDGGVTGGGDTGSMVDVTDTSRSEDVGRDPATLPFPTYRIGFGGTYAGANSIRAIRRRLMFRFNADVFIGTAAQAVGRLSEFDALFIQSADEGELAALDSAESPVFMTTSVAANRLGLTDPREGRVPLIAFSLTPDHPNENNFDGRELLRSEGQMNAHRMLAPGAMVFAEGETDTETLPLMLGVDTDGELFEARTAPRRRAYFAVGDFRRLTPFGEEAVNDAVAWTYEFESPLSGEVCGLVTSFGARPGGAFADRLKLHGCEVRFLEPDAIDTSGLDLVVIGPDTDQVAVGQLLAPQELPVVAFYEGRRLPTGFEILHEDTSFEEIMMSSIEVATLADDLFGTTATGTLEIAAREIPFNALPAASIVEGVKVIATFPTGQPAVMTVDRGVSLSTLETKSRWVFLPGEILKARELEGDYSPKFEAIEFVDYAIEWALGPRE